MMSEDGIRERLKIMLSKHRYMHSLGVKCVATRLARHWGLDADKARLAGLVHDCARELPPDVLRKTVELYEIPVDDIEIIEPRLLHAPVGAAIARYEFGIDDEEILRAIRFHTTAAEDMGDFEKLLYVADYVEPGRVFKGVRELRELAFRDLRRAYMASMEQTIIYLMKRGGFIHPRTVEARNAMLCQEGGDIHFITGSAGK